MNRIVLAAALLCVPAYGQTSFDEVNHAARQAYEAKDYAAMREHLLRLDVMLSGHPRVVYNLACAEALLGHREEALRWLGVYADTGLVLAKADDPDLASLAGSREMEALAARFRDSARPIAASQTVFTFPDAELVPEDIAYDPKEKAFYVSSVRQRKIWKLDRNWKVSEFTKEGQDKTWAMLGLALDPERQVLWATTEGLPQARGLSEAERNRAAVLQYDLRSGRILKRFDLPDDGQRHEPGDVGLGPGGELYVSDGGSGAVYVVRPTGSGLETLVERGAFFVSPQGPAVSGDGRRLFVADYARGIGVVDLASRKTSWLAHSRDAVLNGIDGLRLEGRTLLAVQNGTQPERVLRFTLDPGLERVLEWKVLESNSPGLGDPTHGVVVGDDFYFIANSGWDHMKEDGSVEGTLTPATIRRLSLREPGK